MSVEQLYIFALLCVCEKVSLVPDLLVHQKHETYLSTIVCLESTPTTRHQSNRGNFPSNFTADLVRECTFVFVSVCVQ